MRISRKTTQNINRDQLFKIEELWDWTNSAKTENIVCWVVGQVVQKSAAQGQKGAWIEDICTFIVEQFERKSISEILIADPALWIKNFTFKIRSWTNTKEAGKLSIIID